MSIVTISSLLVANILYPELIIKSITSISTNIISGIYHLISITNDADLQNLLISTDIIEDIKIIKSFIENKDIFKNETQISCVQNLNKTLIELETNINSITKKIEYHKTLWFSYIRSYDISKEKQNTSELIKQLNHRFELLIKICSISN
jgi:hypothetical protein